MQQLHYFIASSKLGIVLQLVLIEACGDLHDVMNLKLDNLGQRSEHTLWDNLQHLTTTGKYQH